MKKLLFFVLISLGGYYLLESCASIKLPSGGPKDTIPPILVNTIPPDQSLEFNGDQVRITFNEMIKVKNLKKKLIITPIIEEYDFKQTKNGVIIKLKEELLPNTTYTFNFTDAIEDVTEGNPWSLW